LDVLVEEFSFDKIGRSPARFDEDELLLLNGRLLHETPYEGVKDRLDQLGVAGGEPFWLAIRGNVEKVSDTAAWSTTLYAPMMPLRRALTGMDHGPEMGPLLALMGAEKARLRLQGEIG